MRVCAVVLAVLCIVACDSGIGPSSILVGSSRGPQGVSVLAGDSESPVPGAVVRVIPDGVAVEAPGFLRLVTSRGGTLVLWPVNDQTPLAYTVSMAYSDGQVTRLALHVRQVSLRVSHELSSQTLGRIQRAVDAMNMAQSAVQFVIGGFSGDVSVSLAFTETDPAFLTDPSLIGITYTRYSPSMGVIYGATVLVHSLLEQSEDGHLEAVVLHELGHVMGLWHTPQNTQGVMSARQTWRTAFTPQEATVLRMLYQRLPATALRGDTEYEGVRASAFSASGEAVRICTLS